MKQKTRIAVVGSGVMGGIHSKIAAQSGQAEIKYVIDENLSKAKQLAAEYNATPLASLGELSQSEADMAFVCVPNNLHAQVAIEAMQIGLDVFCEKPMATSIQDALRMSKTAQQTKKRLFVGHNRRFAPVYLEAKKAVSQKGYHPHNLNIIQNDGDMGGEGSLWAANFEHLGGFLYDTTIHFLDMAEFLMGEISEISALSKSACYPVEDDFVIQLRFKQGGIGAITSCGHASWIFPFERIQVVGDHQSVITEELDSYRYCPGLHQTIQAFDYSKLSFEDKWGYAEMHRHMMEALAQNKPALNDWDTGLRSVKLVEACQKSAANNGIRCPVGI